MKRSVSSPAFGYKCLVKRIVSSPAELLEDAVFTEVVSGVCGYPNVLIIEEICATDRKF